MEQILKAEELNKRYGKKEVVKSVSIELKKGEIVGLLGPNGAGKTTTFYMLTGMIKPNGGRVFLNGKDVAKMPMYKRARNGLGYLPQEASVFRKLSVEDNIMAILQRVEKDRKKRSERLEVLLDELKIKHIRKSMGYSLSGGERRRVEITRSLVTDPDFILLDEPFAGVDPVTIESIQSIVMGLKNKGIGVLITDHNVYETLKITDRAYILFDGRIMIEGSSEFLANDPNARKMYLGENFKLHRPETDKG
ncbi:MAG: LPS export ABC transporter ATP-binding protein [Candidatus Delongbacteria bacterium]|jgi:lipopolysaccharide export system ATP-binding protein|nr:LPS export ABC transporter ATP-binding protein [Candidatus Delongbacteria bacterium]MDY0017377.1 LPS export ABC transporter ATP-binding protein [Candidatus Delongbacteria bacterium]